MKFDFRIYSIVSATIIGAVGAINWLIDPLWYGQGNRLTGQNFAFNERISKTNQFLRTKTKNYDCLILGSSRVIMLRASQFEGENCFNYAFKGGSVDEFIEYAQFAKEQGLSPKTVYVGVDGYNFVKEEKFNKEGSQIEKVKQTSFFHAYFSLDVFTFSAMTLLGMSPGPANYYNQNFEVEEFPNKPSYSPAFHPPQPPQECDLSRVQLYQQVQAIFPEAKIVGYVPPRSAWAVVNETYERDLMNCYIEGFYQVAQLYDRFYDFSIPSEMTKDPKNTWDGSHFSNAVNDQIAEMLGGQPMMFGIQVDQYSHEDYRLQYTQELTTFMNDQGKLIVSH